MELNDIYDENRNLTGKLHRRGTPWKPGEYGVVVCVWVYDGRGHLLLTRRAREKSFAGTWENSGGAVKAGETTVELRFAEGKYDNAALFIKSGNYFFDTMEKKLGSPLWSFDLYGEQAEGVLMLVKWEKS